MPSSDEYNDTEGTLDLWWIMPGKLAGMPLPFVDQQRHDQPGVRSERDAFDDELPQLWRAGVRAIVCLLNTQGMIPIYESAGFTTLLAPIPDGFPPTPEHFEEIATFIDEQLAQGRPVAVHCAAGIGRTGTILAGYLISRFGASVETAIEVARTGRPGAVETWRQVEFLEGLSAGSHSD